MEMEGGGAVFVKSNSDAVGGVKAKRVKVGKGDSVHVGVGVGIGVSQNKILADVTNLLQQPKQPVSTEQLLKEKEMLMKLLANRDAIIESCKAELQKCQINFQKVRKQNAEFALTNSQMLAEHNSSRQKEKKEQTSKLKPETNVNEVRACQNKQSDQSFQEDNKRSAKRRKVSQSRSSAPAVIKQFKSMEKLANQRYSLRRQSASLKDEKPEPTEDFMEEVEIKDDISNLQENLANESGTISLVSKVHDEARETTESSRLTNSEQVHPKRNIEKKRNSMRRLTNRFKPENPEPTEDSKPTNTEKFHPERNIEKKRNSMRRQTNRFKPENPEPTEDSFELNDSKVNVSQLSDNMSEKCCPTSTITSAGQENNSGSLVSQETRRSSVGRPLRRTVEKVVSYKEVPLNVKMRRDKSGNFVINNSV
ncbi:SHUGOSHIN 2 isoform X4 [Phaseolus vulgaris]|uniref:SHUGOSHIN 2 isoform X4 n=1 Tax=Phaseolus vulgaris TaxID=3885 RepID=UPI0035CA00FB